MDAVEVRRTMVLDAPFYKIIVFTKAEIKGAVGRGAKAQPAVAALYAIPGSLIELLCNLIILKGKNIILKGYIPKGKQPGSYLTDPITVNQVPG